MNRIFPRYKPRAISLHTLCSVTAMWMLLSFGMWRCVVLTDRYRRFGVMYCLHIPWWLTTVLVPILLSHIQTFCPTRGLLLYPEDRGSILIRTLRSGWPWSTPNIWSATPAMRQSKFITEGPSEKLSRGPLTLDLLTDHCPLRRHLHVMDLSNNAICRKWTQ
jgi:hypothetical protein